MGIYRAAPQDRTLGQSLGLAGIGAAFFVGLSVAYVILGHRLLLDGLRHAFTLGFVTQMIFGLSARLIPKFSGTELRWAMLRTFGALLILIGFLMREVQIVAAYTSFSWPLRISGVSGLVAFAGIGLASASLFRTLKK
jgi:hypothetical protein